jgi:ribosomal protein L11 methyltransferase
MNNYPDYIELVILTTDQESRHITLALLSEFDFEAFQEDAELLRAFIQESQWNDEIAASVKELLGSLGHGYELKTHSGANWNTLWEDQFTPVEIEPGICRIIAPFHEKIPGYQNQILIQPKMAFGTGHHPTTQMMIRAINSYNFKDKSVLDYGTGTGILAIYAMKRGAVEILGTDIDPLSIENAMENEALNHISLIKWEQGQLGSLGLKDDTYDIILANIQLNVLIENASELFRVLKPMGLVFLSGVLAKDQELLLEAFGKQGLELDRIFEQENWICAVMRRFTK